MVGSSSEEAGRGGRGEPSVEDQGTADVNVLAQQFGELARQLQTFEDAEQTLEEVVQSAVRLIPGADDGSISVVMHRRRVTSRHPSSDLPRQVDALKEEFGQGPCLDAAFEQQTVRVSDMATEARWPRFAPRAADVGARSMLSFQLQIDRLRQGLATRDLIGQAKGILMERHKLTADQAFRVLVRFSNDHNRPLRLVAQDLAATGALEQGIGETR